MKKVICGIVLTALLSLSAFAASGKGKMELMSSAQVAGKQLTPGNYKVSWTGDGNDVQVTINAGKNTVVTAPAKLVEMATVSHDDAVVVRSDGSIKEVHFGGKKTAIVFAE